MINTPAQVHRFKNSIQEVEASDHTVSVLARDDGCTKELLNACPFEYEIYGRRTNDRKQLFRELPRQFYSIAKRARAVFPGIVFGHGTYSAIAGFASRTPSVAVTDDDNTPIDHFITARFGNAFLTPRSFRKDFGDTHHRFDGTTELAYLSPRMFEPDSEVLEQLSIGDQDYAIVRFNSFGGLDHDKGATGFSYAKKRTLIEELEEHVEVFISWEGRQEGGELGRPFDIHPAYMHDALSFAKLVVSDTQTIITEAALLGTPAIRSNSFVGGENDLGYITEFEELGLIHNLSDFDNVLKTSINIASGEQEGLPDDKRRDFIERSDNLTDIIVSVVDEFEEIGDINRALEKVVGK